MTNFWYPNGLHEVALGNINLGSADLRVILCELTNTTQDNDANRDANFIDDFTTLNEHPTGGREIVANTTLAKDAPNNRSEVTADPTVWTALVDSGENVTNAVLYLHVATDADSIPIASFNTGGFPFTPTGSDNTITWNVEGMLQIDTTTGP